MELISLMKEFQNAIIFLTFFSLSGTFILQQKLTKREIYGINK